MCGRYALSHTTADLQGLFGVVNPEALAVEARYNIAPTQTVTMIYRDREGDWRGGSARWGLVPHWVKDPRDWKASTFNARSEDVGSKPTYRQAFRKGRILLPASGFYEWKSLEGVKRPFHVRSKEGAPLAFAGLMDVWRDAEGENRLVSCTILTTSSSGPLAELHHRMPVMVRREAFDAWLSAQDSREALDDLLASPPLDDLEVYEVTREVNDARANDPSFTLPLAERAQ